MSDILTKAEQERQALNQAISTGDLPAGYKPGISTAEAAAQAAANNNSAPLSRADELFKSARLLRDKIDSKRLLRDNIVRCIDGSDYYEREKARLSSILANVQMQLTGLELNREQGPARIEQLDRDIERLQSELVATQNKAELEKLLTLAMRAGIAEKAQ